jgi:hypothetical protein
MNERIRELAVQSGMSKLVDSWEYERFAELIVRECINRCAYTPDVGEDWDKGVKWVANEIAQYFGVKE